jgi:exodeoxyribonuclease III
VVEIAAGNLPGPARLRLVTWNCQGAFRKKYTHIAGFAPDLAVIQECEHPDKLTWKAGSPPTSMLWVGDNATKGLGIFSWSSAEFSLLDGYDARIRYCVPIQVQAPYAFNLIAVWAMDTRDSRVSYSAQIYQAIAIYRDFILEKDTVFMGDFNSSTSTTPKSRLGNHTTLTTALHDLEMVSAYHQASGEKQGKEKWGTFYRGRKRLRITHIDYAYIPVRWIRRLKQVQVGDPDIWLQFSDHAPLIVDIQEKKRPEEET